MHSARAKPCRKAASPADWRTVDRGGYTMGVHLITELERLKTMTNKLTHMVSHDLEEAIEALLQRDRDLALQVIANDDVIDRLEIDIEEECLKALALYQPVAGDLRYVVAVLKLNSDLERIGDLAVSIAEVALILIDKDRGYQDPFDVRQMCASVNQMVENVLQALIQSNTGPGLRSPGHGPVRQ